MRNLTLRAWDEIEGGWVDRQWIIDNIGQWCQGNIPKEIIIQRSSGVFCNGQEVFEGDIVNTKLARYVIKYQDGMFVAICLPKGLLSGNNYPLASIANHACIVGNSFENPELMS